MRSTVLLCLLNVFATEVASWHKFGTMYLTELLSLLSDKSMCIWVPECRLCVCDLFILSFSGHFCNDSHISSTQDQCTAPNSSGLHPITSLCLPCSWCQRCLCLHHVSLGFRAAYKTVSLSSVSGITTITSLFRHSCFVLKLVASSASVRQTIMSITILMLSTTYLLTTVI